MKRLLIAAACVALGAVGLAASSPAWADWHGRIWVGPGPWWWGPPYPYYYYPPVVTEPAPVYMQPPVTQVPAPPAYWYFCREANAYYPYVGQCPGGWEQVTPQQAAPPAPMAPPTR